MNISTKCLPRKKRAFKRHNKKPWFDQESRLAKRRLNSLERKYGKNPSNALLRQSYYEMRKEYRKLLTRKKIFTLRNLTVTLKKALFSTGTTLRS